MNGRITRLLILSLIFVSLIAAPFAFAQETAKKKKSKKAQKTEQTTETGSKKEKAKSKDSAAKKADDVEQKSVSRSKPAKSKKTDADGSNSTLSGLKGSSAEPKIDFKEVKFKKRVYNITQAGIDMGVETFEHSFKDGVYIASSEISLVPLRLIFRQKYAVGGKGFGLIRYDLDIDSMGSVRKITAYPEGEKVVFKHTPVGGTTETKLMGCEGQLILLDNNNANNYQYLVDSYSQERGGKQRFVCLVPQTAVTIEVEIERTGFVKGKLSGAPAEYIGYSGRETGQGIEIRVLTFSDGSLASVEFPQKKFRFAADGVEAELPPPARIDETREININGKHAFEKGVFIESGKDVKIFGKIITPVIGDPTYKMPAALIIAGSGPTDGDGNSKLLAGPVNNLKNVAEHLALNNVVTLRYDKRCVGYSSVVSDPSFTDYVDDARKALEFLSSAPGVDPKRVFVIGHSEGGLIALKLAAGKNKLRGLILMAAPFETFEKVLTDQAADRFNQAGAAAIEKEKFMAELSYALSTIKSGKQYKYAGYLKTPDSGMIFGALQANQRFIGEIMAQDPAKIAADVKLPSLVLNADMDIQMKPSYMDGFYNILSKNCPDRCEKLMVKGANHVFKPTSSPKDLSAYTDSSTKVVPQALKAVADFVNSK